MNWMRSIIALLRIVDGPERMHRQGDRHQEGDDQPGADARLEPERDHQPAEQRHHAREGHEELGHRHPLGRGVSDGLRREVAKGGDDEDEREQDSPERTR
jgi:hypothetical protein